MSHVPSPIFLCLALLAGAVVQENFLKYMRKHFGLDRLIEQGTLPLPETTLVVNPACRQLDQQIRRERGWLDTKRAAADTCTAAGGLAFHTWACGVTTTYGYNHVGDLQTVEHCDATPSRGETAHCIAYSPLTPCR